MKIKKYMSMPVLFMSSILCSVPVLGAEAETYVEMHEGEQLFLPDKGEITIADENIAKTGESGNIEALEEGETEVLVRYKIRVKKSEAKEEDNVSDHSDNKIESHEIAGTKGQETDAEQNGERESEKERELRSEEAEKEEMQNENTGMKEMQNEKSQSEDFKKEKSENEEYAETEIPDFTCPEIVLENLAQLSANAGPVKPVVVIRDENPDGDRLELILEGNRTGKGKPAFTKEINSGEIRIFLGEITEDDAYTLTCKASDTFGNTAVGKWIFTVNQQGTKFECLGEEQEIQRGFAPKIGVDNVDAVEVLACSVNGEAISYVWENGKIKIPKENLKQGKNRISVTVQDAAGNISEMEPWEFVLEWEEKKEEETVEGEIKMGKESPLGIIFLLFGSVLVFWEKKIWYNKPIH